VKAFRQLKQLRPERTRKKWLLSILRNTRIDRLRASAFVRKRHKPDQSPRTSPTLDRTEHGAMEAGKTRRRFLNEFSDEA